MASSSSTSIRIPAPDSKSLRRSVLQPRHRETLTFLAHAADVVLLPRDPLDLLIFNELIRAEKAVKDGTLSESLGFRRNKVL